MSRRLLTRTLTAAGVLAIVACSDSGTGPSSQLSSSQQSADLAVSAGSAIASDVTLLRGDMVQAGMGFGGSAALEAASGSASIGANCAFDSTAVIWTCARTTENGLNVARTITFFQAGAATRNYDASLTDSIAVHASIDGTITKDNGTMTIAHTRDVVVSGLAGTETARTVNGSGTWQENSTFTGDLGTRTYAGTVSNQLQAIVYPVGGGYPLSGTLVHDVNATVTRSGATTAARSVSRHIVVTFNGTASVPMTVGTVSCTLHLDTKTVSCGQ